MNCGQNFKKTVSFEDIVHFIEEQDIETYEDFDCGITFYPATPTKIRQNNRERNYISSSRENSKCLPSNDRHNCLFDEQHNSSIFLNPHNLWDMVPADLMSLSHTNDIYSISNQNTQPTTHQPRLISSGVLFIAKDSGTQIHTIQYYIAEIYHVLIHWWGVYVILLLCPGTRYLITLFSYTRHYYILVVYCTLTHCWAIPNPNTMLRWVQSYYNAD